MRLASLVLAGMVASCAAPVAAQSVACGDFQMMFERGAVVLNQHPVITMDAGETGTQLFVFVNPKTKEWTMIAVGRDGVGCVVASGNNFHLDDLL